MTLTIKAVWDSTHNLAKKFLYLWHNYVYSFCMYSYIMIGAVTGWTSRQSCDEVRNITWIDIVNIDAEPSAQDACHCRVFRPKSLPWQEGDVVEVHG